MYEEMNLTAHIRLNLGQLYYHKCQSKTFHVFNLIVLRYLFSIALLAVKAKDSRFNTKPLPSLATSLSGRRRGASP